MSTIRSAMFGRGLACAALASLFVASPSVRAAESPAQSFFATHCLACHGEGDPQAGLDLATLSFDKADAEPTSETRATWIRIHDRIAAGEMPPKSKPRPAPDELKVATDWLAGRIVDSEKRETGEARTALRRLTRVEYEQTLRDLFHMPHLNVRELLPGDGSAHGFDNNADALDLSHVNLAGTSKRPMSCSTWPSRPGRRLPRFANSVCRSVVAVERPRTCCCMATRCSSRTNSPIPSFPRPPTTTTSTREPTNGWTGTTAIPAWECSVPRTTRFIHTSSSSARSIPGGIG